jgi:transposase-like protein
VANGLIFTAQLTGRERQLISGSAPGEMWLQQRRSSRRRSELKGRAPGTITLDGYAASHRAVREMKTDGMLPKHTKVRSSKYLNNVIEQDHRHIKSRVNVMLGFKRFRNAAVKISGIELVHRIRKGQFDLTAAHLKDTSAPSIWMTVFSDKQDC